MDAAGAFLAEVAYGSTKELTRLVLAGCIAILMSPTSNRSWIERMKVVGALVLLAIAAYLFALRMFTHVSGLSEESIRLSTLLGLIVPPPPPPPPPPPLTMVLKATGSAANNVVALVRARPYQTAAIIATTFLVDLLNLGIVIDRFDPLVRLARGLWTPVARLARAAGRLVQRQRLRTSVQAAVVAGVR